MKHMLVVLLISVLLCAQESPFKEADDAYAQGKLRMAEKLYQEIAVAHPDTQVQADAFLRLAWVQYSLNEKQQCLYGLEKALFLNPKLTVDPNIYNQEFFKIYEMAILRRTLVSASSAEDPLGDRPVPIPPLSVPPKELPLPVPPLEPLAVPKVTPFHIPMDKKVELVKEDLPGSLPVEGDVVMAVLVDSLGKPRQAWVYSSDFPQFSDAILRQFQVWKFTPATKGGRPVAVWTTVVLHFKTKYKWDISSAKYTPVGALDPVPVFVAWGFTKDRIPPEYRDIKFKDAENIQDVDTMPDLKDWDLDLADFKGKETIQGILHIGPDGRPRKFQATKVHAPGIVTVLESELRKSMFTPPVSQGRPSEAFLNVELQVEYHLNALKLLNSKNIKVNIYNP
jgi:hypothetical protein